MAIDRRGSQLVQVRVSILMLLASAFALPNWALDWQQVSGGRWAPLPVSTSGKTGFSEMPPSHTGINFTNWLPEERYLTNQILLNGSGVAAGDIDGDGWCDLFFCGIDRPCALYRNLGDWRFADITAAAGVACQGQPSSGAVFADVDGDGDLDLLVNGVGAGTRLFLNDGRGHFEEATAQFGLQGKTGSMSIALADIDGDGYLDLYVANYRSTTFRDELEARFKGTMVNGRFELSSVNGRPLTEPDLVGRYTVDSMLGILENGEADVLYLNDGHGRFVPLSWTDGRFADEDGQPTSVPYDWGLSVMFRDLNGDGAPDLYVCNDFHTPDRIWINDGHGRFRAIPRLAIRHTSLFSMGIDFADIDRDGHDDFFVADMLSRHHASRQVQLLDRPPVLLPIGIIDNRPQYSQNTIFRSRGDSTYAEIARLSGVEASEWTWCPVFLDVDLDGFEDLLLVTGHLRDAQNIDISRRIEALRKQKPMSRLEQLALRKMFSPLRVSNLAFRNRSDLTFEEMSSAWSFDSPRISQGISLADLDNDGDLDVVINCLNDGPLLLRNNSNRPRIAVRLRGLRPNTQGIGSKIQVIQTGMPQQSQEVICGGRYLSGDDPMRVFAAAQNDSELRLLVEWRGGRRSVIDRAKPNRVYELDESQAKAETREVKVEPPPMFADVSRLIPHRHADEVYDDYQRQPLLPFKLSQLGPGVTWFDLDGDGWEDLIIPSGRGGRLAAFHNDGHGGFIPLHGRSFDEPVSRDQTTVLGGLSEAGGPWLIAGSANYEEGLTNAPIARTYDVAGQEVRDNWPGQLSSTGPMTLADLEGNGHLNLFVGGRVVPGRFPEPATSMIFRQESGTFRLDPIASQAFAQIGLASDAIWTDLNGDGVPELVLACHGGSLRVFRFAHGKFEEVTESLGFGKFLGLWNSVNVGDFNGDGRLDIVAGNWGRNTPYQSHLTHPLHLYYNKKQEGRDFPVEAYYDEELKKIVPFRDWETLATAMPFIRERYHNYSEFSTAGISEILGERLSLMHDMSLNTLDSMVFLNRGDRFEGIPLPLEAQFAPVFGIAVSDFDGDGNEDIVISQNFFEISAAYSRLDAGRGLLLKGNGKGGFVGVPGQESGIKVYGEGRGVAVCDYDHDGRADLVIAQNSNATQLYHNTSAKVGLRVLLQGPPGNRLAIGATIRLQYQDGRLGPVREVHAGGGYWSQDATTQVLGIHGEIGFVIVRWPGGGVTKVRVPSGAREMRIEWKE